MCIYILVLKVRVFVRQSVSKVFHVILYLTSAFLPSYAIELFFLLRDILKKLIQNNDNVLGQF